MPKKNVRLGQLNGESLQDDEGRFFTDRPDITAPHELRKEPVCTETLEDGLIDAVFGSGAAEGEIQLLDPLGCHDFAQVHVSLAERRHDPT